MPSEFLGNAQKCDQLNDVSTGKVYPLNSAVFWFKKEFSVCLVIRVVYRWNLFMAIFVW